jgi:hypothetical protein
LDYLIISSALPCKKVFLDCREKSYHVAPSHGAEVTTWSNKNAWKPLY